MSLSAFIQKIDQAEKINFNDAIAIITEHYHYQPTEFSNGLGDVLLTNPMGVNEGSCKILAFAKLHQLDQAQTLNLFGDYYWHDVLGNPTGNDHKNIRNFMQTGWQGVIFKGTPLMPK